MDLNGDGNIDLLTAAISGLSYIFYGNEDGTFNNAIVLKDKSGTAINLGHHNALDGKGIIINGTNYVQNDFVKAHDWDNDGDLDLLLSIGKFTNMVGEIGVTEVKRVFGVKLRINEGSKTNPVFGTENIDVVPAHFADAIVDWDGDGLWDIVGGSKFGGVYFYKNKGRLGSPSFGKAVCLIKPSEFVDKIKGDRCGITQLTVADYNNDGKLDLIIGARVNINKTDSKFTKAELKEMDDIHEKFIKYGCEHMAYFVKYFKKCNGNTKGWEGMRETNKLRENDKDYIKLEKKYSKIRKKLANFNSGRESHGYVWVSLRE